MKHPLHSRKPQSDCDDLKVGSNSLDPKVLDTSSWYASLDTIRDGIVLTDHLTPNEPIIFVNKAFAILTGYSKEEVIGRNCRFLQENDRDQAAMLRLRNALRDGTEAEVSVRNYRKDGSMFVNRLTVAPLRGAGGAITHFIGVQHDMSKELELVKAAKRGRAELTRFFEESRDLLITLNRHRMVKRINPVAVQLLGAGSGVGIHAIDLLPKEVNDLLTRVIESGSRVGGQVRSLRIPEGLGVEEVIQWSAYPVADGDLLLIGIDVTEYEPARRLDNIMREQRGMLDSATDGFVHLDRDWRFVYVNRKAEELLGESRDNLLGKSISQAYPESIGSRFHMEYREAVASQQPRSFTEYHTTLRRWLNVHCFPQKDGLALLFRDLTEQADLQSRLSYLARYDSVTRLPNRHSCLAHLERLIYGRAVNAGESEDDHPARFAVLYLDLDRFKALNDTAGHTAGDAFLAEVGERIASELQDHGFLGRISGDEFMIAVEGLEEAKVKDLAERIVERIAEPFAFGSHNLTVGASIGIATYPEAGHSADQLLQNADTAMYFAKRAGRYCVRFYTREMAQIDADKLLIFHELRNAISLKQLQLFYQPKFDLHTGTLAGSEALLRWNHPTRGLLGPMAFIGVAEESALILEIGSWVLREACRQFAAWRDEGIARLLPRIDINLSARQLVDPRFPDAVSDALSIHGLSANNIGLEITESMLTEDMDQAAKVLEGFRSMGMSVALDDFGTGYSNLSYIQRFPITTLKVDKSFVQQMETSENSRALVNGIISMARALKLLVVAEGVETYTQLEFLIAQQCDAIQGYIVSPAVPAHTFREKFLLATPPLNILNMREVS